MKISFAVIIVLALLSGCVSVDTIDANFVSVNPSDGVDQLEAQYVAQKQCLIEKWCKSEMNISYPEVKDGDFDNAPGLWHVYFHSKDMHALDHIFIVSIDKKSGKVLDTAFTQ